MRKSARIITALSVTGLAVVAGSAFTGAGLSTSGTASQAQFLGGTVTQNVTGATLSGIEYGFEANLNSTTVNSVTLTFAAEIGNRIPTIALTGTDQTGTFSCTVDGVSKTEFICTGGTAKNVEKVTVTVPTDTV